MNWKLLIPILNIVFDVLRLLVFHKIFKYSNFPEIIHNLFAPFITLLVTQVLLLIKREKPIFCFKDIATACFLALIYLSMFRASFVMAYKFSFSVEALSQVISIFSLVPITGIVIGRKPSIERNMIVIIVLACCLAFLVYQTNLKIDVVILYMLIYYIELHTNAIIKHIFYVACDPTRIFFLSSFFVSFYSAYCISSANLKLRETSLMINDIKKNPFDASLSFIIHVISFSLEFLTLRHFVLDVFYFSQVAKLTILLTISLFQWVEL